MMNLLKSMGRKLKDNKGEVSVEWALIAVIMAVAILAIFNTSVRDAMQTAINTVTNALTTA